MQKINRRSAVALGLAAASVAVAKTAAAQTTPGYKDEAPSAGVVRRTYDGQTAALIPGFKTVSMRDVILQPGSKTDASPMMNAMLCHITEGELQVEQDGKTFAAKKNYVWTCNKGTKEQVVNNGNIVAVMRIIDLIA
jgi:quercetin dioxygenase-like cupin family protein